MFTECEKRVINELVKGGPAKQIAETLGLKVKGVKHHLTRIYKKSGVQSKSMFIVKYYKGELKWQ